MNSGFGTYGEGLLTFQLDHLYREVLLAYTKYFEITEYRLFRFGVTVYLDTKEIASILPVNFALQKVSE